VINPSNYKFGTTSICRVPLKDRSPEARTAFDPTTGCLGCASGKGSGPLNIFGNKYGQYLAAVQMAREERIKKMEQAKAAHNVADDDDDDDDETDDNDEDSDDEGPKPAGTGVWAGPPELGDEQTNQNVDWGEDGGDDDAGDDETDDDDDDDDDEGPSLPPAKKVKHE